MIAFGLLFTLFISVASKRANQTACVACGSGPCSLLPVEGSVLPCYQGTSSDANFCYNTDPLVSDSTPVCGQCTDFGFPQYVQNDPVWVNMELWFEGAYKKSADAPKVFVESYFEALCPGCQDFMNGAMKEVMAMDDIVAITNFKIVPYGNTKEEKNGDYTCQHGEQECATDVLELCTLYKLNGDINSIDSGANSVSAWPFISCMEEHGGYPEYGQSCFQSTMSGSGLDWEVVSQCSKDEASDVQHEGSVATPDHDYVPWVLVDGRLLQQPNLTLLESICRAYTGTAPESCKTYLKKLNVSFNN